jgi:hypothetical protein
MKAAPLHQQFRLPRYGRRDASSLVGARVGQMKQKPPTDGSPRRM